MVHTAQSSTRSLHIKYQLCTQSGTNMNKNEQIRWGETLALPHIDIDSNNSRSDWYSRETSTMVQYEDQVMMMDHGEHTSISIVFDNNAVSSCIVLACYTYMFNEDTTSTSKVDLVTSTRTEYIDIDNTNTIHYSEEYNALMNNNFNESMLTLHDQSVLSEYTKNALSHKDNTFRHNVCDSRPTYACDRRPTCNINGERLADTQAADITSANPDVCSINDSLIPYDRKNNTINSIKVNEEHGYNNLNGRGVTRFVYFNVGIRIGIIAPYIYSEKICTVGRQDWYPSFTVDRLDWYPSTLIGIFWFTSCTKRWNLAGDEKEQLSS